jgi:hypothetical protein
MLTLVAPVTLEWQNKYLWKPRPSIRRGAPGMEEQATVVCFLGYEACPAVVYILDANDCKRQIERSELFEFVGASEAVANKPDLRAKNRDRFSNCRNGDVT